MLSAFLLGTFQFSHAHIPLTYLSQPLRTSTEQVGVTSPDLLVVFDVPQERIG